ncbi:hypothetical protein PCC7424_3362 [Gloeothece citriformis PCC 7424]|uniref:Heavy metal translocating P-type ATPase n=1 Tax=Gloeothece citriformis (strain PCC 7424) TaxID=65393 RepID=B7KE60_GLOC7|nr:hypothetical protein [Gloeothece citriformis]ACK71758.1 hypothetical protein PCC7424_3362 [Gloeothece citriformis PCC 7424]
MNNVESTCEQQGFEILHSVANRVRLRALDTKTKNRLTEIAQHLRKQAGIQTVRINQDTGNLVITYDQSIVSRAQVQRFLEPYGVTQETPSPELLGSDSYAQTLKRLSSFIPPVVGIAAARGLGVGGWQGLATYIVTSRVTRGVMNQFDLPFVQGSQKDSPLEDKQGDQTLNDGTIETTQSKHPAASDYRVIHEIPGRIRLSIPRVKGDLDYVKTLENLAQRDNRITSVRVNRETGSVVIQYRTGIPSNTRKTALKSSELIALLEQIASDTLNNPNTPKNNPTSLEETTLEAPDVHNNGYGKPQEIQESLEPETVAETTDTDSLSMQESEPVLEEEKATDQPDQQEEQPVSSSEQPTNSIVAVEPDHQRFELSAEEESESPWRRFKACMLTTMLRFMANFPLQQA